MLKMSAGGGVARLMCLQGHNVEKTKAIIILHINVQGDPADAIMVQLD